MDLSVIFPFELVMGRSHGVPVDVYIVDGALIEVSIGHHILTQHVI